ncbi:MAG: hypothetical protein KDA89_09395 [Planctomycetaceae bacterium]|nr:hypothetical protein [Planctomycetaceae bacterium]
MPEDTKSANSNTVVLLATDLMLCSSVSSAAAAAGRRFVSVRSGAELLSTLEAEPNSMVLLDLSHPDALSLVQQIPEETRRQAVAFGPHVQTSRLDAASNAGIRRVLSRGQFSNRISALLTES